MKRTLIVLSCFSLSACIEPPETSDEPAQDEKTSTDISESIALTGKRSRGSNSQEKLPGDRYLSDFNADGVTDLIRFASTQVYVNRTDYGETPKPGSGSDSGEDLRYATREWSIQRRRVLGGGTDRRGPSRGQGL